MECGISQRSSHYPPEVHHGVVSAYGRFVDASHLINLAATPVSGDTTPPGIFLRLYIFGGLAFVILIAWLVLRGYRDSGDSQDKNRK
jgi:hypothetical protein